MAISNDQREETHCTEDDVSPLPWAMCTSAYTSNYYIRSAMMSMMGSEAVYPRYIQT